MAEQIQTTLTILRRRQVEQRVGLTRSPLYARIKAGTFPKPVQLGNGRAVGWLEHEIVEWLTAQVKRAARLEGARHDQKQQGPQRWRPCDPKDY